MPFFPPHYGKADDLIFVENRKHISISGYQEKFSLKLDGNNLRLTEPGERGDYILKPVPLNLKRRFDAPANEHLTMQIARQVYGINTAVNALIFFKGGQPAYITKRFDVNVSGDRLGKEDFATLAGKTAENAGPNFKYDLSYEEMALLIKRYVPAWRIEVEKFFKLVIFNYLFSNGDAHLKNFALLESPSGDYLLSPAYDLINTQLHISDSDFALTRGLFKDGWKSNYYFKKGHPSISDFVEFANRIGISEKRFNKLIKPFLLKQKGVDILISCSFLSSSSKRGYNLMYNTKLNYLTEKK